MLIEPKLTPVTVPVDEFTVANALSLLLQVPAEGEQLKAVVPPLQTKLAPLIAPGAVTTVKPNVAGEPQPVV
jgi:hypothetical protein